MAQASPLKAGILFKKSEVVKQWNERWAAIYPGEIVYWKSRDDSLKGKAPRGRIALSESSEVIIQGSDAMVSRYKFELRGQTITAHFAGLEGRIRGPLNTRVSCLHLCSRERE